MEKDPCEEILSQYPEVQQRLKFIRDLIERRDCLEDLRVIKDHSNLIFDTIYTMKKFTRDDYDFLRGIYTQEELLEFTYDYLKTYAKEHSMDIKAVKTKMGFDRYI